MFGTTPGGSKIVYDRLYLLKVRDSPASHVSSIRRFLCVRRPTKSRVRTHVHASLILIESSKQSSADADMRVRATLLSIVFFRPRRLNCHLYQVLLPHVDLMIIPLTIRVKPQLVMHQKLKLLLQWNLSQKRKMTWKCNVATLFNATIFTATEIFLCSNETPTMCSGSHFKFTVKGTLKMDQSKFGFSLS